MDLKDVKFLSEVAEDYKISLQTLHSRVNKLIEEETFIEGVDYKKGTGLRQPIILSKQGIEKIINKVGDKSE